MTTATFDLADKEIVVEITGHARYARDGADIVCASCSTLAYTLYQAVAALHAEGELDSLTCTIDDKGGYFYIRGGVAEEKGARVEEVARTIIGGYALLEKRYPENVKLRVISGEQ